MYEFFKDIAQASSCALGGICSIHPSISALYQIILAYLKEISFYVVKLKSFKLINKDITGFLVETLSIFLINTNFNKVKYLNLIKKLCEIKNDVKNKYIDYCSKNNLPIENITSAFDIEDNISISGLIELAQAKIENSIHQDKDKQGLFELITLFSRLASIDLTKLKNENTDTYEFDFKVIRFFALTNSYSIGNEKLIRRIKEFSKILIEIRELLFEKENENYGEIKDSKVQTSLEEGHSILVSGDDLKELKDLLETLNKSELKEKINVYTHGPLLRSHFYSYFKNNKNLTGHYGTNNAEYDFSNFKGVILITQNFIQKIDSLYRGEIFSSKLISFEKVIDISDKNYLPVIETALKTAKIENKEKKNYIEINKDIVDLDKVEPDSDNEIILIFGSKVEKDFKDKKVLFFNYPLNIKKLIETLDKAQKRNIKFNLFFSQCDIAMLETVFCLLDKNVELTIANCPYSLINPHCTDVLKNYFEINII